MGSLEIGIGLQNISPSLSYQRVAGATKEGTVSIQGRAGATMGLRQASGLP